PSVGGLHLVCVLRGASQCSLLHLVMADFSKYRCAVMKSSAIGQPADHPFVSSQNRTLQLSNVVADVVKSICTRSKELSFSAQYAACWTGCKPRTSAVISLPAA